jgi:hypothetical protein
MNVIDASVHWNRLSVELAEVYYIVDCTTRHSWHPDRGSMSQSFQSYVLSAATAGREGGPGRSRREPYAGRDCGWRGWEWRTLSSAGAPRIRTTDVRFHKIRPERWARSCGMTSVGESVSARPQIEPLANTAEHRYWSKRRDRGNSSSNQPLRRPPRA